LNLFKDIGVALKDYGGASSGYQKALQHLTVVHTILQQLETFKSSTGDLPQINAIRGQSQLIEHDVAQFLKRLEKYKDTLGGRGRKGLSMAHSQRSNGRNMWLDRSELCVDMSIHSCRPYTFCWVYTKGNQYLHCKGLSKSLILQ